MHIEIQAQCANILVSFLSTNKYQVPTGCSTFEDYNVGWHWWNDPLVNRSCKNKENGVELRQSLV